MLSVHAGGDRVLDLSPVTSVAEIKARPERMFRGACERAAAEYVVALVGHTRRDPRVELGASPRAGLMLLKAAKASAVLDGRDHALPDDVKGMAIAVRRIA